MEIPKKEDLNCNTCREKYIISHYGEFYEYIKSKWPNLKHSERLYLYYAGLEDVPVCEVCGGPVKFYNYKDGYAHFCCNKCVGIGTAEIKKQHCIEKYGVENPMQSAEVREKLKRSVLAKYGVENPAQAECIKEKLKGRIVTEETKEKTRITNNERYGGNAPTCSEDVLKKREQNNIEKFGAKNIMQTKNGKSLYIKTIKEKYGDEYENISQVPEIKEKIENTMLEHFGYKSNLASPNEREKIYNIMFKKYGYKCASKNEDIKRKISETCLERYGVEWFCLTQKAKIPQKMSKPNQIFAELLEDNQIEYEREFNIGNRFFDFKVGNILIEINPTPTHNADWNPFGEPIGPKYHKEKTQLATENGFRVINVWDWDDLNIIIKQLKPKENIYSRKCTVMEITPKEVANLLIDNHLQGNVRGQSICLGLYYNDILVQVMTFGKPRYNKKYQYELLRLCTDYKYRVIGGSEKLFTYFINKYNPESIISYCDNSKFNGSVYSKLGFKLKENGDISKHWYNIKTKQHITDNLLRQRGYDQLFKTNYGKGTSNEQLMLENGFLEVFDCGQATWIFTRQQPY